MVHDRVVEPSPWKAGILDNGGMGRGAGVKADSDSPSLALSTHKHGQDRSPDTPSGRACSVLWEDRQGQAREGLTFCQSRL